MWIRSYSGRRRRSSTARTPTNSSTRPSSAPAWGRTTVMPSTSARPCENSPGRCRRRKTGSLRAPPNQNRLAAVLRAAEHHRRLPSMSTKHRFKLLQFNMQYGQMWDDAYPDHAPIRVDLTLDEIRAHNADIVMLQEVEQAMPGGAQADPPPHYTQLKAELKGYDSYFCYPKPDSRELPFGIGLAIFSKTPLREHICL